MTATLFTVFTIGHSRHTAEHFLTLLHANEIDRLVDVRSQPRSKWAPHFDTDSLARLLGACSVDYVFLGRQLGGRPEGREFYRQDGSVDYARRATAPDFADGISRLVTLAQGRQIAILCAEEDPSYCHRRLLVAPALARSGATVVHVRGDGRLEPERDSSSVAAQLDLFGERP
jgi:uncharacterized protein (DUF488 family)